MPLQDITIHDERLLQDVADSIARSHKVLVITGAGISTSCGIPDFRSKDGLYNLIPEQNLLPTPPPSEPSTPSRKRKAFSTDDADSPPSSQASIFSSGGRRISSSPSSKLKGEDLFHSRVFQSAESTTIFYQFIASLRQKIRDEVKLTSPTHKFIRTLRDGGRLMRCYTQNIDGLEAREGLCTDLSRGKGNKRRYMKKYFEMPQPQDAVGTDFDRGCEVVQLHGDLDKLRCNVCSARYQWTEGETEVFLDGFAPKCEKCNEKSTRRQSTGKRGLPVGALRPNIVLYGEEHPSNTLLTPFVPFDAASQPEVLIIMGTSLKVFGLQKIIREFAKAIHARKNGKGRVIFVNRTRPAESVWDGIIDDFVAIDCDEWVEDLRQRRSDLWLRQGEIDLKVTKSTVPKSKRKAEAGEEDPENRPAKKAKFVVEVPQKKRGTTKATAVPRKDVPQPLQQTQPRSPGTPAIPRATKWRGRLSSDYPGRKLLSPLVQRLRPEPSPLTNSFKPLHAGDKTRFTQPGSPKTPLFSPITPKVRIASNMGLQIFADPRDNAQMEIAESDHEKENKHAGSERELEDIPDDYMEDGEEEMDETPTHGPGGRKVDIESSSKDQSLGTTARGLVRDFLQTVW